MKILGIETSCDETAVAIIEISPQQDRSNVKEITVLSNVISSQVKLHAKYGGVVPNLAAREHVKNIEHVFELALKKAGMYKGGPTSLKLRGTLRDIDLIAVTRGPGLGPSLLVGIAFARTLAWKYNKPLVGVNHLEGHVYSNCLKPLREFSIFNFKFPILNLIVSGGHTELVLMEDHGKYKIVGETLDDAVGEAFDKVARLLGLGYPGGPTIALHAERWKSQSTNHESRIRPKIQIPKIEFPRPMIRLKNFNFSYAGLKTAVLYKVRDLKNAGIKLTDKVKNEICYEFQNAALDVLVAKTVRAVQEYRVKSLFLSGGVSANALLRSDLNKVAGELGVSYSQPEMEYTGDNAAMIAVAGYFSSRNKKYQDKFWNKTEMDANLKF